MSTTQDSVLEQLADLTPDDRAQLLTEEAQRRGMTVPEYVAVLQSSWDFTSRPKQRAPEGTDWMWWFIMAGRGFGKTISGAQWTKKKGLASRCRIALLAPTLGDVRETMIEGETGLLSILPNEALYGQSREVAYNKTHLTIRLANDTLLRGFSSETPSRSRGPQHHYGWLEEVSSFNDAGRGDALETTFSNFKLGLRLGKNPQAVITSTPKANRLTRDLIAMDGAALKLVKGSSYENRANLPEAYWNMVVAPLEGTRTGRQEILAELLDDVEGALWTRWMIDRGRIDGDPQEFLPLMRRVVVGVDPNTTYSDSADDAGIVVGGQGQSDGHGYVLGDVTVTRGGPRQWATAAVHAFHDYKADLVVAETNNGGDMVIDAIHAVDATVPVKKITASRGKATRAEPVAIMYGATDPEQPPNDPKIHHVGFYGEMEDEMTTWVPGEDSPNRMDALVWAMTELGLWHAVGSMRTTVPQGRIPTPVRSGLGVRR